MTLSTDYLRCLGQCSFHYTVTVCIKIKGYEESLFYLLYFSLVGDIGIFGSIPV
jgi:hypothetical protein